MGKVKIYVVLQLQENCIWEFRCMYATKRQAVEAIRQFYNYNETARYFINEQYRYTNSEDKGFWCEADYEVMRNGTALRKNKLIQLWED